MPYIGNIVQDFSVSTAMLNTDSVTSIKVLDGTIVNADINASAAIAGTKISPDFGSQAIVTTGAITGQDFRTASSQTFFLTSGDDWNFRTITGSTKLTITNTGQVDFAGNVDCNAGLDVTGNITTTSGNLTVDGEGSVEDIFKITDAAGTQRLLMGNRDSAGVDCPRIFNVGNAALTIGIGDSWSGDGGTLTNHFGVAKNGTITSYGNHDFSAGIDVTGDINCGNINSNGIIDLEDASSIKLGTDDDFILSYDNSNNQALIAMATGKRLKLKCDSLHINNAADNSNILLADDVGAVSLFFGTIARIATTSTGATVTGNLTTTGNITASGGQLTLENTNEEQIHRFWTNTSDSDISGLLSGSTFGTIVEGANNGHHVIALRDNDVNDSFAIISGGGDFKTGSPSETYDTLIARFKADGKVGIGTSNPGALLHVDSDATTAGIKISGDGNSFLELDADTSIAGTQISFIDFKLAGTVEANIAVNESVSGNPLELNSATDHNISMATGGGNVGIGTASPDSKLKIEDSSDLAIHILKTGSQDTLLKNTGQTELCAATGGSDGQRIVFKIGASTGSLSDIAKFTPDGLCFGTDTAATNALDDYEEGTAFTSTGNATVHQAAYTKVGKMVTISFRASVTTGNTQQMTLPFAHSGNHGDHCLGVVVTANTFKEIILDNHSAFTLTAGFSKGTLTYPTNT